MVTSHIFSISAFYSAMVFNDKGSPKPEKPDDSKRPILVPKNSKRAKKKDRYIPVPFADERSDFDFIF